MFLLLLLFSELGAQLYPMQDFIGVNICREDPVKYF
jgi:hypothetical protein